MDSNLNENQIYEEFLYNQKPLLIENNSFNSELESKWNEIEEEKAKDIDQSTHQRSENSGNCIYRQTGSRQFLLNPLQEIGYILSHR